MEERGNMEMDGRMDVFDEEVDLHKSGNLYYDVIPCIP